VRSQRLLERGNVAPHYNKKTFRRQNYLLYTIQCIIGYQKINEMRLRLVGGGIGAVNNRLTGNLLTAL
jgi:hypothetical protein